LPEKERATWREAAVALILVGGLGEARFVILCVCVCACVWGSERERKMERKMERKREICRDGEIDRDIGR